MIISGKNKRQLIVISFVLVALAFTAVFTESISPYDPLEQNVKARLLPPSSNHIFGTDGFGRDVFSRVLYGFRVSLYVALIAVASSVIIGIPIGAFAAYRGGWFDLVVGRIVDTFLGFPFIVLALIIVVALETSATSVGIAVAAVLLPRIILVTRSAALIEINEPYIDAARMTGAGGRRIVIFHILPNCAGPPLTQAVGFFGTAIATESILSYLGLGIPPPYPSWGRMIQEGTRSFFEVAPWLVIFPGLAIFTLVLGFSWFSEYVGKIRKG